MSHHNIIEADSDHWRRFGGIERLYAEGALARLHNTRVAVIGVGGVGSWAVEALVRSGVGNLMLIDLDHVALSNINRQIQALDSTCGKSKVAALQERILDINANCCVTAIEDFVTADNMSRLFPPGAFDFVIDACDEAPVKAALIAHARFNRIRIAVCGAAGGKKNPAGIRTADLAKVTHDALLARIRNMVRRDYRLSTSGGGKFNVPCVYLEESSRRTASCDAHGLNCAGYGSSVVVTAIMGFTAASLAIESMLKNPS
jgi:tRNA threonylcarbamoyladenosine dehydratase